MAWNSHASSVAFGRPQLRTRSTPCATRQSGVLDNVNLAVARHGVASAVKGHYYGA